MTYIPEKSPGSVSVDTTMVDMKQLVLVNATGAQRTITLPAPSTAIDIVVMKTDASINSVVITPPSGTINGAATETLITQYASSRIMSDGTNYFSM